MNEGAVSLPWLVIRQDDNGNRYRVGRYATHAEAQETADTLDGLGDRRLYWVERVGQIQPHDRPQPHDRGDRQPDQGRTEGRTQA